MLDLSKGVKAAVEAFGTQTALADALGIERSAVSQWKQIPHKRVLDIEAKSDGRVTRQQLRPDLYPPEADAAKPKRRAA